MEAISLLGSALGLGFVSGLNLYATVLTVGLSVRFGLINLNPEMADLSILSHPAVLITAGVIFLFEFVADKVPWVDSLWDAIHTIIRPLGAAAIGATAVGTVSPEMAVVAFLCGGVALTGHSAKAGTRLLANHSPEPFSNIALSLIEDGLAVTGVWLALAHPYIALALVLTFLIIFIWFAPKAFRLIRVEYLAAIHILKKSYLATKSLVQSYSNRQQAALAGSGNMAMDFDTVPRFTVGDEFFSNDIMPEPLHLYCQSELGAIGTHACIRCVAGKGVKKLRHSVGYLQINDENLVFVTRRLFRIRHHTLDRKTIDLTLYRKKLLLDRLTLKAGGDETYQFYFFKDKANRGEIIAGILQANKQTDRITGAD